MNLGEKLLLRLADWRPAAGRQTLTIPDDGPGWALSLTVDRAEQLGCLVWELAVRRSAGALDEPLQAWGERIAGRVTGLLEPLKVVEVDAARREAILRSEAPASRGDEVFYYEVLLTGAGTATLRRYHAFREGNGRREQVAFALTHEALAKVAADLTASR